VTEGPGPVSFLPLPTAPLPAAGAVDLDLDITSLEFGQVVLPPHQRPEHLVLDVLRLHLTHPAADGDPPYLDILSHQLIAALAPLLRSLPEGGLRLRLRRTGTLPRVQYQVDVLPPAL
jgi:hypothetical protein